MVFIFGTRATTGNPIQTHLDCPACKEGHSIMMVPQQHYFHLFWVPIFPTSKTFTPICSLCGAMFTTQSIPVSADIRKQYKTPKWTMFGIIALGVLLFTSVISIAVTGISQKSDLKMKIEAPQIDDIYHIEYGAHQYSLMRVVSFTSDSVYFNMSPGRIDKKTDLDKLAEIDAYDTLERKGFSKEDLKENSLPEIKILKIER